MAELAVWNKYGWGATKEVFGIAEAQDVGVEGPDMGERIEKAKKIKEKEEKEKEKEKEGKGQREFWSEGGSRRPAYQGSCYNCGMYDILQDIVDWGRDKELEGSKVVVTPVESGDTLQRGCPHSPPKSPGGMGAGMFHQHQGHRGGWFNGRQGQGQHGQGLGFIK
jgi:hypothetical protein